MFFLMDEQLESVLNDAEDVCSLKTIPEGITEEQLDTFLRVLKAHKPTDIEDIATEDIIELLYLVQEMAPYIGRTNIFDNGSDNFTKSLLAIPSMKRRRVL